jgi:hypothetical protein
MCWKPIMDKQTQILKIRYEPSYNQPEVKTNWTSFLCGNDNILQIYHYWLIDWCLTQGCFTLENKTTENQWKIAETIYTPVQMVYFGPVLTLSSNFEQFPSSPVNANCQLYRDERYIITLQDNN